jgi:competence ComEA-like helix-hairpin-helix protein
MHLTPQERLALGVTALLIAAGTGARVLQLRSTPAEWIAHADTSSGMELSAVRETVSRLAAERRRASEPLRAGERIDVNTAPAVELERLPRVGPALAARIVAHRQANGAFRTLGDLDAVSGIGPALLESLAPHVALAPGPARSTGGGVAGARGGPRLDLNRASETELQALPGIGPALAARIVQWRREHGPFETVEALEQVPGVGPALRARLAPHVTVGR